MGLEASGSKGCWEYHVAYWGYWLLKVEDRSLKWVWSSQGWGHSKGRWCLSFAVNDAATFPFSGLVKAADAPASELSCVSPESAPGSSSPLLFTCILARGRTCSISAPVRASTLLLQLALLAVRFCPIVSTFVQLCLYLSNWVHFSQRLSHISLKSVKHSIKKEQSGIFWECLHVKVVWDFLFGHWKCKYFNVTLFFLQKCQNLSF